MMFVIWFALCLVAVFMVILAIGLFLKGQNRQKEDAVFSRLKLQDVEEVSRQGAGSESNNPVVRWIARRLVQAGYEPNESGILISSGSLAVFASLLFLAFGPVLASLTVISLLLIAQIFLMQRAARRHKQLMLQLPDFLDRLLRPLIAGNTIEESFAIATRESPEPIRSLFLGVARQVRLGAPLEEAISRIAVLHELADLHALAMATQVHRRYGGSIRKMVKSLIHLARSRETSAQELRALTAETRMSAWVLVAIPVGITTFILLRNPDYYTTMWSTSVGRGVLIFGFVLQLAGAFVIWRMMRNTAQEGA